MKTTLKNYFALSADCMPLERHIAPIRRKPKKGTSL